MRNLKEFLGRQAAGTVVAGDRAGRFFFDYGDAEPYRQQIETVRRSFEDIDKAEPESP